MQCRLAESLLDAQRKHAASGQSQKGLPQVGVAETTSNPGFIRDTRVSKRSDEETEDFPI